MSCWDCVGAECPLQFIHDKEGSFPKSEAGSFTSRSLPRPAMKTTFPYSGRAETSRRSMLMYGRHVNMWHSPLLSLVKHENIADLCPSLQHCSLWAEQPLNWNLSWAQTIDFFVSEGNTSVKEEGFDSTFISQRLSLKSTSSLLFQSASLRSNLDFQVLEDVPPLTWKASSLRLCYYVVSKTNWKSNRGKVIRTPGWTRKSRISLDKCLCRSIEPDGEVLHPHRCSLQLQQRQDQSPGGRRSRRLLWSWVTARWGRALRRWRVAKGCIDEFVGGVGGGCNSDEVLIVVNQHKRHFWGCLAPADQSVPCLRDYWPLKQGWKMTTSLTPGKSHHSLQDFIDTHNCWTLTKGAERRLQTVPHFGSVFFSIGFWAWKWSGLCFQSIRAISIPRVFSSVSEGWLLFQKETVKEERERRKNKRVGWLQKAQWNCDNLLNEEEIKEPTRRNGGGWKESGEIRGEDCG